MNDPYPAPGTATGTYPDPHGVIHDVDKPASLLAVYVAILACSAVSILLSMYMHLGQWSLPVQLAIGAVQATIVLYYFMHLKRGDNVVTLVALSALFWTAILFVLFLSDYLTRAKYQTL